MLAACSELIVGYTSKALSVQLLAAQLLAHAAADLPPLPAGGSPSSTSTSSASSSTSTSTSSNLTAGRLLWQQLEQSGLLQKLPAVLSCQASHIQQKTSTLCQQQNDDDLLALLPRDPEDILKVMISIQQLQPGFLTVHAAGQQCVVPAMQLGMSSMRHISAALAQEGSTPPDWMRAWMIRSFNVAANAGTAAKSRMESICPGLAIRGVGLVMTPFDSSEATQELLAAEETTQWFCLSAVLPMLMHFTQQATAADAGSSTTTSRSSGGRGSPAATASSSSRSGAAGRSNSSQPPASSIFVEPLPCGMLGGQWLPAALAPSIPAAYRSMLEQLGCSSEVGLWLAGVLSPSATQARTANTPQRFGTWDEACGTAMLGLYGVEVVRSVRYSYDIHNPQLAPLYLSVCAATLQWLSSMEPGRLTAALDRGLGTVCKPAARACRYGLYLWKQQGGLLPQQQQAAEATHHAVVQLGAAVLEKLLGECRGVLGDSGEGSSTGLGGNSSSRVGAGSSKRSAIMTVTQACVEVAAVLEGAYATAAQPNTGVTTASSISSAPQHSTTGGAQQAAPVQHAQYCKLLQDYVRLVAIPAASTPSNSMQELYHTHVGVCFFLLGS